MRLDPAQSVAHSGEGDAVPIVVHAAHTDDVLPEGLFEVSWALSTVTGAGDLSGDFENAVLPDATEDEETESNSESRPHTGLGRSDSSLLRDTGYCDAASTVSANTPHGDFVHTVLGITISGARSTTSDIPGSFSDSQQGYGESDSAPTVTHAQSIGLGDVVTASDLFPAPLRGPAVSDIVLSESTPDLSVSVRETCVLSDAAQARQRSAPDSVESEMSSNLRGLRGIPRAPSTSTGVGTLSGVCDRVLLPPDGTEGEESEPGLPTISRDPSTSVSNTGLIGDADAAATISVYPSSLDSVTPTITHPVQRLDDREVFSKTPHPLDRVSPPLLARPQEMFLVLRQAWTMTHRGGVGYVDSLPELPDDSRDHAVNVRRGARPTLMSSRSARTPGDNPGNTYRESVRALAGNVRSAAESIARLLAPPRQRPRPN